MSDGITHGKATTALILPVTVAAGFVSRDIATAVSAGLGCSFVLICGCDLDIDFKTENEFRAYRINRLFGFFWYVYWLPYAKLIPHRHFISHAPVISTIIRDIYLFIPAFLVVYGIAYAFMLETAVVAFVTDYAYLFAAFVAGQICADTLHYLMDVFSTKTKRIKRKIKGDL